jgi:23S rRNA (adenine2503-C2)-methyltransferase
MGLIRNLTAGEIVGQVETVVRKLREPGSERPVSNVVFMGMGEPLANLEATVTAVEILLDQRGLGLSRRHLTVSTAGLVPAMGEFVHRVPAKLAVSLNATTDEVRSRIMPINDRFGLTELMDCCRNLPLQHTDRVTFEYVMLAGVNDSLEDARRLTELLSGIRAKVNLIPFNPFEGIPFSRPEQGQVEAFQEHLISRNISAFVRRSRGEELRGACGQLVAGGGDE